MSDNQTNEVRGKIVLDPTPAEQGLAKVTAAAQEFGKNASAAGAEAKDAFGDDLTSALAEARLASDRLTASTAEQRASIDILGTSYEKLNTSQREQIGLITQQLQVNAELTAELTAAAAATSKVEGVTRQLDSALRVAQVEHAKMVAVTGEERQSLELLGVAYDTLTAGQREQIVAVAAQVAENEALAASQNAAAVSAMELRNAHRMVGEAGTALTTLVTLPILAIGKASFDAAVKQDSLRRSLTAVMGSASAANAELERLREIGKGAGLGFDGAVEGFSRFHAAGLSINESERALRGFSRAVAEFGGGKEQFQLLQEEIGRLVANPREMGRAIEQLSAQLPDFQQRLKAAFGSADPVQLEKKGVTSAQIVAKIAGEYEKLNITGDSLKNRMDNASDAIEQDLAMIGNAVAPVVADIAEGLLPALHQAAQDFEDLPDGMKTTTIVLLGLAAGAGPVAMLANQFTQLARAIAAAKAAGAGFSIAGAGAWLAGPGQALAGGALTGEAAAAASLGGAAVLLAGIVADLVFIKNDFEVIMETLHLGKQSDAANKSLGAYGTAVEKFTNADQLRDEIRALTDYEKAGAKNRIVQGGMVSAAAYPVHEGSALDRALKHTGLSSSSTDAQIEAGKQALLATINRLTSEGDKIKHDYLEGSKGKNGKIAQPTYDEKETEEVKKKILELTQTVALNGDTSEVARLKWELFHGELQKVDPALKSQVVHLAEQADAMQLGHEHAESYAKSLRELQKQIALAGIGGDSRERSVRTFQINQRYADPSERLSGSEYAQMLGQYKTEDTNRNQRDDAAKRAKDAERAQTEAANSIKSANRSLEEGIQSLNKKLLEQASGEQRLTHVQEAELVIAKARAEANGKENTDYERRIRLLAQQSDAYDRNTDAAKANAKMADGLREAMTAYQVATGAMTSQQAELRKLGEEYGKFGIDGLIVASIIGALKARTEELTKAQSAAGHEANKQAEATNRIANGLAEMSSKYDEVSGRTDYYDDALIKLHLTAIELTHDHIVMTDAMVQGVHQYADAWKALDTLEAHRRQLEEIAGTIRGTLASALEQAFERPRVTIKAILKDIQTDTLKTLKHIAAQTLADQMTRGIMGGLGHVPGKTGDFFNSAKLETAAQTARNDLLEAALKLGDAGDKLARAGQIVNGVGSSVDMSSIDTASDAAAIDGDALTFGGANSAAGGASTTPVTATRAVQGAQAAQSGDIGGVVTSGLGVAGLTKALPWVGLGLAADSALGDPVGKLLSKLFHAHLHLAGGAWEVPGSGFADSTPALLTPGEMVLPRTVAGKVRSLLHGGGLSDESGGYHFHGPVNINDKADMARVRSATSQQRRTKFGLQGGLT